MSFKDRVAVREVMDRYFEGLYHSDSAILRTVFHNDLSYVNGTAGSYEVLGFEAYIARIDARPSPASRGDPRHDVIERIVLEGDQIGFVQAQMTMMGRNYQDLLTLIKTDTGWKVLAKVFSYVERKD